MTLDCVGETGGPAEFCCLHSEGGGGACVGSCCACSPEGTVRESVSRVTCVWCGGTLVGPAGRGKLGYIGTWGGRVFWNWYPSCGPLYWFGGGPVEGNVAMAAALYGPNWVPSAAGCLGTSFPLPENRYLWSIPISRRIAMVFFWATLLIWGCEDRMKHVCISRLEEGVTFLVERQF